MTNPKTEMESSSERMVTIIEKDGVIKQTNVMILGK
jgi:hypothetical protein